MIKSCPHVEEVGEVESNFTWSQCRLFSLGKKAAVNPRPYKPPTIEVGETKEETSVS